VKPLKKADRIISLVMLLFCIWGYVHSSSFTEDARVFPQALMILWGALSAVLFLSTFRRREEKEKTLAEGEVSYGKMLAAAVLCVIYVWSIGLLGFFVATPVFFALTMVALGQNSVKMIALSTAIVTVASFVIFRLILYVPFPEGALFS
jgi:hypothetical protein